MPHRLPVPAALAAILAGGVAVAHAGSIQDDISACGAAAVEAGLIEADGTLLRFVSDEGNRDRTLTLKAIGGDAEPVLLDCKMKRSKVLEVVRSEG